MSACFIPNYGVAREAGERPSWRRPHGALMTADPPSPADELASFVERGQKAQAATRFHIDENQLYRKIPILRRLIPSVRKRIRRIWPSGHTRPVRPVRLTGLDAPLIHIFGDSHSGLFAATPGAVIHYIGPVTMHKVGRDGVQVFGLDLSRLRPATVSDFVLAKLMSACMWQTKETAFRGNLRK